MTVEIPEGFTAHIAGQNPAPGKKVIVLYADGEQTVPTESEWFGRGMHNLWKNTRGGKFNIVAYRVVT